jgi:hypothetical protein
MLPRVAAARGGAEATVRARSATRRLRATPQREQEHRLDERSFRLRQRLQFAEDGLDFRRHTRILRGVAHTSNQR